jgi:ADP-ribose pyrophosphatase
MTQAKNPKWDVLAAETLLDVPPWLRVYREHVRLPNGYEIDDYYRVDMPEWSQVFAVTADGRVPMIEQYKHGAGTMSLELPAGYIDAGEAPEDAARREFREEVGMEADDWRYLGYFFTDGNRGCGGSYLFLARGARQIGTPDLEESEIFIQHRLTLAEVRAAWLGGRIRNTATMAAVGLALAVLEGDDHAENTGTPRPDG